MAMRARNRMLVLLMASTTVLSGCATIGEWLSVDFQMKHEHIHHERCDLKPEGGLCKAAFKKYYFNHNRKRCEPFIWGGCAGVVPFETFKSCVASCE